MCQKATEILEVVLIKQLHLEMPSGLPAPQLQAALRCEGAVEAFKGVEITSLRETPAELRMTAAWQENTGPAVLEGGADADRNVLLEKIESMTRLDEDIMWTILPPRGCR